MFIIYIFVLLKAQLTSYGGALACLPSLYYSGDPYFHRSINFSSHLSFCMSGLGG